jgi:hypothetical protein
VSSDNALWEAKIADNGSGCISLLFAGLLMNYDRVPKGLRWMQTTSFFHAAYEALLVNELRYLQLVEHKVSFVILQQAKRFTNLFCCVTVRA